MNKKNNVLKVIGIIAVVVIGVPLVKLAAAFLVAALAGLAALVVSAPLVVIPLCLVLGVVALIDYAIARWLIKAFRR